MRERIPYTKPSITDLEISYTNDAVRNGWGEKCYEYINKFENAFKDHLGVKYAIATSSATGALHMGLAALGIGEGDEVILANTNWVASIAPILYLKAKPVLVDINEDDWCLNIAHVKKAITKNTKAILAVHLYGNVCEMDELLEIAKANNLYLIEDAAEAIGSVYKTKKAGAIGDFGFFSFHGTKTLTTGEGGIFVTNNPDLYDKVLTLSNHGRSRTQTKQFWPDKLGYKYKMSNVQAAIGLGQLERINELIDKKKSIFHYYNENLSVLDGVYLNPILINKQSGFWMPNVVFDNKLNIKRDYLINEFKKNNIDARVFFWPLSTLSFINVNANTPVSFDLPNRSINLPSFHDITKEQQNRVISVIFDLLT